jgi:hypothetical protein
MGYYDKWTTEQENTAKVLLAAKADNATFLEKVGRTKQAAYAHWHYIKSGRPKRERRTVYLDGNVGGAEVKSTARPTEEMLIDARRRASAPRPLTAWLNGDPPPGQSALDKKHAESHTP